MKFKKLQDLKIGPSQTTTFSSRVKSLRDIDQQLDQRIKQLVQQHVVNQQSAVSPTHSHDNLPTPGGIEPCSSMSQGKPPKPKILKKKRKKSKTQEHPAIAVEKPSNQ